MALPARVFHMLPLITLLFLLLLQPQEANAFAKYSDDPSSCVIEGDNELYGLGIRYGLYLQFAATILSIWICPEEMSAARASGNMIAFVVIVNTLRGGNQGGLLAPELFIVQNLTFMNLSTLPFTMDKKVWKENAGSLGVTCLVLSICIFSLPWVYFENLGHSKREACALYFFLFFKPVNVYEEKWAKVYKALSIVVAVCGLLFPVYAMVCIYYWFIEQFKKPSASPHWDDVFLERHSNLNTDEEVRQAIDDLLTELDEKSSYGSFLRALPLLQRLFWRRIIPSKRYRHFFARLLMTTLVAFGGALAIFMVEKTIKTNKILVNEPVGSSGQFMALMMGAIVLLDVLRKGVKKLLHYLRKSDGEATGTTQQQQPDAEKQGGNW